MKRNLSANLLITTPPKQGEQDAATPHRELGIVMRVHAFYVSAMASLNVLTALTSLFLVHKRTGLYCRIVGDTVSGTGVVKKLKRITFRSLSVAARILILKEHCTHLSGPPPM